MPRPKGDKNWTVKGVRMGLYLPADLVREMREISAREFTPVSVLIRDALRAHIDRKRV